MRFQEETTNELFDWIYTADYEEFKSNICHVLADLGDYNFVNKAREEDLPNHLKICGDFYAVYCISLLDYLCNKNGWDIFNEYDSIRNLCFKETMWPRSIELWSSLMKDDSIKEKAIKNAIPEFLIHNIVEGNIEDVK